MMNANILRRYTSLPVLLNILNNKKLTLLDPQSWEDKNDSYYLNLYKNKMGFKSVLALCFTEALETYHHWKVFSGNSSGVCIHFDKNKFLSKLNGVAEIRSGYVIYKKLDKVKIKLRPIDKLPFLKRYAFRDEIEFRLIYQSKSKEVNKKDVSINIPSIEKITFGPWIPRPVFSSVKAVINKIDGCSRVTVRRSTILDNKEWKKLGHKMA